MAVDLGEDVARFVDDVSAALVDRCPGQPASTHVREALIEASNIIAARDRRRRSTGRRGARHLPRRDRPEARPAAVRHVAATSATRELLDGRAAWLHTPSVLFDLLVRADARNRTHHSHRYYALALRLTHVTAALDLVPSPDEIRAIDAFRTTMLRAMDAAGLPRPGQPDTRPIVALRRRRTTGRTAERRPASGEPPLPGHAGHRPLRLRRARRVASSGEPKAATAVEVELPPARPLEDLLTELDSLIGLTNVKAEVRRLTSMLQVQQIRAERGLPTVETSHHLVFSGNPGHRQDHRRPPAEPGLPRARRRRRRVTSSRPTAPDSSPATSARPH